MRTLLTAATIVIVWPLLAAYRWWDDRTQPWT